MHVSSNLKNKEWESFDLSEVGTLHGVQIFLFNAK